MVAPGLDLHHECSHLDYVGVTFTLYYIRDRCLGVFGSVFTIYKSLYCYDARKI